MRLDVPADDLHGDGLSQDEYAIEGSAQQQFRRHAGLDVGTDRAVALKHAVYALSFLLGNVFLAWVIGGGPLRAIVTDASRHLADCRR